MPVSPERLAQAKRKKSLLSRGISLAFDVPRPIRAGGRALAADIAGAEIPEELVEKGTIREAISAIPDVLRGLRRHPIATLRGFAGGAIAGLTSAPAVVSPLGLAQQVVPAAGAVSTAARTARAAARALPRAARARAAREAPEAVKAALPAPATELVEQLGRPGAGHVPGLRPRLSAERLAEAKRVPAPAPAVVEAAPVAPPAPPAPAPVAPPAQVQPRPTPSIGGISAKRLAEARRLIGAEAAGRERGLTAEAVRELAPGPSRVPLASEVGRGVELGRRGSIEGIDASYLRRLADPKGGVQTRLLITAAGGVLGATQGETTGDRAVNALIGASAGYVTPAIVKSLRARAKGAPIRSNPRIVKAMLPAAQTALRHAEALDVAQLLAHPVTIARATGGALGGLAFGLAELTATGQGARAATLLKSLKRDFPREYLRVLKTGEDVADVTGKYSKFTAEGKTNPVLNIVLRPFKAADAVAFKALTRAGYTEDQARNILLTGPPTTEIGRRYLSFAQANALSRFLLRFPRTQIQSVERGLVAPFEKGITPGQRAFRAATIPAAAAAGFETEKEFRPSLPATLTAGALAGPLNLPFLVGAGVARAKRKRQVPELAAIREVARAAPLLEASDITRLALPGGLKQRVTPRIVPLITGKPAGKRKRRVRRPQ